VSPVTSDLERLEEAVAELSKVADQIVTDMERRLSREVGERSERVARDCQRWGGKAEAYRHVLDLLHDFQAINEKNGAA
jgi:hypothetical protein